MKFMTGGCGCSAGSCDYSSRPSISTGHGPKVAGLWQNIESTALLQEVRNDQINGCSEEVEEWEEIELLVDSGASATVIGVDVVRGVKASDPDPNRTDK